MISYKPYTVAKIAIESSLNSMKSPYLGVISCYIPIVPELIIDTLWLPWSSQIGVVLLEILLLCLPAGPICCLWGLRFKLSGVFLSFWSKSRYFCSALASAWELVVADDGTVGKLGASQFRAGSSHVFCCNLAAWVEDPFSASGSKGTKEKKSTI